jgi:hypothetical protein
MSSLSNLFNVGALSSAIVSLILTMVGIAWILLSRTTLFPKILILSLVIGSFSAFFALTGDDIQYKKNFLYVPLILAIIAVVVAWVYNIMQGNDGQTSRILTFAIGLLGMVVIVINGYLFSFPTTKPNWLPT